MSTEAFYDQAFDRPDWKGPLATDDALADQTQPEGNWMRELDRDSARQHPVEDEHTDTERRRAKVTTELLHKRHEQTSAAGRLIHWTRSI